MRRGEDAGYEEWEDVRGVWGKRERMLGMRESCLTACRVWQLLCVGFSVLEASVCGIAA